MAGMCKAKARRKVAHKGKRTVQNKRTYQNILNRRTAHAKAHGMTLEKFMEVNRPRRWASPPVSK